MNPAQLLAHFDRISDAPEAIPRLRRFILDLAVRGKLVEQDTKDEPASELLKRVQLEKERLVRNGTIRKRDPLPVMEPDHAPFVLPLGWIWCWLGELIHLVGGQHLQPGEYTDQRTDGPPYVTGPADFGEQGLVITRYATVVKALATKGQILLTVKGAGVGKTAVCDLPEVAISRQLMAVTAIQWNDRFLLLTTHRLAAALKETARSLIPGISREDVEEFIVGLPPLAEQHRIVAKVDELMALCDQLERAQSERESRRNHLVTASLHRLNQTADAGDVATFREHARLTLSHLPRLTTRLEHIQQLRQTILNLAVRGKLVPQAPNDEPASRLHQRLRLLLTKAQELSPTRTRRDTLSSAVTFFGNASFPPSWVVTNLDNVNAIVSGVAKGKDLRGLKTATYPYLRVANVQRGHLDLAVVKKLEIRADEINRYRLQRGDVLMTEGGDWDKLGRAAVWNDEIPNCIHQNHIYRIRSANTEELLPAWIALFANSPMGRSYFEGASKQTTNLASINMTQLRSCPLPLPPVAEQQRIVAKVDELMALCDRLEAQLATAHTESRRLLEVVLQEALAPGELLRISRGCHACVNAEIESETKTKLRKRSVRQ
jgi:type I restriction enzyme, S subunit